VRGTVPTYLRPHVEQIEAYRREVFLDLYLRASGERAITDRAIHGRYPELNDGRLFRAALDAGDLGYARALANLCLTSRLLDASDRLAAAQLDIKVTLDGAEVGLGRASAAWASAATEDERRRIGAALAPGFERREVEQRRWLDAYGAAREALGFDEQAALIRAVHGDVSRWLDHAQRSLDATRDVYLAELREWRRRDGVGDSGPFTLQLLLGGVRVPAGGASSDKAVRQTAAAWGFHEQAERIPIDLVARPGKLAGAMCARIDPPRDVRVTSQPGGGLQEYTLLLHEFGHGLHFTTGPDRPFDVFGDDQSISEGFGITFQTAATEPAWLAQFVGVRLDDDAYARLRFAELARARHGAVHVLYEHRVFSGADAQREFVDLYRRELGVEISPHLALTWMLFFLPLQPFYALHLHQAQTVRQALWRRLSEVGGPTWYANDRCHELLTDLFRSACELDFDEVMAKLGVRDATTLVVRPGDEAT